MTVIVPPEPELGSVPPLVSTATTPVRLIASELAVVEGETFTVIPATAPSGTGVELKPNNKHVADPVTYEQERFLPAPVGPEPAVTDTLVMSAPENVIAHWRPVGAVPPLVMESVSGTDPPGVVLAEETESETCCALAEAPKSNARQRTAA
ncbi:MAG: hypothetical protein WDO18_12575 [Acidobacteriota bacterium]